MVKQVVELYGRYMYSMYITDCLAFINCLEEEQIVNTYHIHSRLWGNFSFVFGRLEIYVKASHLQQFSSVDFRYEINAFKIYIRFMKTVSL